MILLKIEIQTFQLNLHCVTNIIVYSKCFTLWIDDFVVGDSEVPTTKLPPKPSLKGKPKAAPTKKDSSSDSDDSDDEPPGGFCDARI